MFVWVMLLIYFCYTNSSKPSTYSVAHLWMFHIGLLCYNELIHNSNIIYMYPVSRTLVNSLMVLMQSFTLAGMPLVVASFLFVGGDILWLFKQCIL